MTSHSRHHGLIESLPEALPWATGHFGVLAGEAAFASGEQWLNDLVAALAANAELLAPLVNEHLDCRGLGLPDDPAAHFGAVEKGFARVNFATSPSLFEEAMRKLGPAAKVDMNRQGG